MDAGDTDALFLRAFPALLADLREHLEKILWSQQARDRDGTRRHQSRVDARDLSRMTASIERFQEEPQLLDTTLRDVVPELVSAFLVVLNKNRKQKPGFVSSAAAISRVLYVLCKARGERVIVGFFNNEPRWLEPLLSAFEEGTNPRPDGGEMPWEERYILLLWLSHLMLAPFDLSSISSQDPSLPLPSSHGLHLPAGLPQVSLRAVTQCMKYMQTATKERDAAAKLLARLALRPDMRKLGVPNALVQWAATYFAILSGGLSNIHQSLGILCFLSKLAKSASKGENDTLIPSIYKTCQSIIGDSRLEFLRSSAVARSSLIKTFRSIVLLSRRAAMAEDAPDATTIMEEVIQHLLEALADSDTPVRNAASKALGAITLHLGTEDAQMATEVIQAILDTLSEDVLWEGPKRNLAAVDPLRWHGLTLTLAQLLHKRAPKPEQIPDIVNALILALTFEQRSSTGSSVGSNVRDAANYGIWALSRRYTSAELLVVDTSTIRATNPAQKLLSIPQVLAIELVAAACCDPVGNIRRGSSGALQELIGRHPDTVAEGITLVQTVDFQGVGLRSRAMTDVSLAAAKLDSMYWDGLASALLGWRGIAAAETSSRISASKAFASLGSLRSFLTMHAMVSDLLLSLKEKNSIEERHGLMLALAECIIECKKLAAMCGDKHISIPSGSSEECLVVPFQFMYGYWNVFGQEVDISPNDLLWSTRKPELTAAAIMSLVSALSKVEMPDGIQFKAPALNEISTGMQRAWGDLDLCLPRQEKEILQAIPEAAYRFIEFVPRQFRQNCVQHWINLVQADAGSGRSPYGGLLALGAVTPVVTFDVFETIVKELCIRCYPTYEIDSRVVALQSLSLVLRHSDRYADIESMQQEVVPTIRRALLTGLDDYTVNERGDVGSLVRLAAIETASSSKSKENPHEKWAVYNRTIHQAIARLALEKLDKVRIAASRCLADKSNNEYKVFDTLQHVVSSYEYFRSALAFAFEYGTVYWLKEVILEGYYSAAAMGTETTVQASRKALVDALEELAVDGRGSLVDFGQSFVGHLDECVRFHPDRKLVPVLEVLAFLLDMQILQKMGKAFSWRNLHSLVQKSHYKSSNLQKIATAIDVYRGLADVPSERAAAIKKLQTMLLHQYPKIRVAAAEALFMVTENEQLKPIDWSAPTKDLKVVVGQMENRGAALRRKALRGVEELRYGTPGKSRS
ncbi:hypothetical protein K402DRAFT_395060 [Aulographum hederae CBS 113979]|uniref:Uncharacterized protein n=1 Tax=Aulographum hederae CBS 113979 TaxID=1176131 RepID=A0A6G1GVL7_9PEZI|nr:hypothetical protein K402DRAFT_395060 [Aulographum hederae CBS 113979]